MTQESAEVLGLWNIAAAQPERIALIAPTGREVSYRELAGLADRYAGGLRALGLRAGDAVVSLLPNGVEAVAFSFAAHRSGLYLVTVDWHLAVPDIAHVLIDSEAKAFVAGRRFAESARLAADAADLPAAARFSVGAIEGFKSVAWLGAAGIRRPGERTDPDVVAPHNTGSFGPAPHGIHVHLAGLPLYRFEALDSLTAAVQSGHRVVLMDGWDAAEALRLIERHRVTHSRLSPALFDRLLALPEAIRSRYDLSSLRRIVHGPEPCSPDLEQRMTDWWGPVFTDYRSQTEGGPIDGAVSVDDAAGRDRHSDLIPG
ncbi:AMP-binding protein [Nocardia cyriacigeorgica]|uniref:AMP-binding protein n=1 Tax=Nocardia cyriacigeorgica TaxID=135487 RepID=UPI001894CF35|nr:AMP-binding protein [Nocardia cyriacigeorgica]MBF6438347.1 AMP-binding protein [Nocardia cyriacigeorgica]MBF6456244.1 AMP-binding protein [Nocardia cyriacigeorgica]MBF6477343.1 AMP-binding protein [Nocardia cyriacigeorgica]MBF6551050.1 AMP-binding protein [Nocardia cyriacigeorgica]